MIYTTGYFKTCVPHWCTYWCNLIVSGQVSETFWCHISFTQLWRPWRQDEVSSRNLAGGEPRFCAIDTWSSPQKNLILTLRYLCQNFRCHVVALIEIERFCIVTHCYAVSFSRKLILCQTKNVRKLSWMSHYVSFCSFL